MHINSLCIHNFLNTGVSGVFVVYLTQTISDWSIWSYSIITVASMSDSAISTVYEHVLLKCVVTVS